MKGKRLLVFILVILLVILQVSFYNVKIVKAVDFTGADVVEYARKFLGNPYKSAEEYKKQDIETGCDCSHFVWHCYEHFDSSIDYASSGSWISKKGFEKVTACKSESDVNDKNCQAGDVVVWDGHVGIYSEKGKMVDSKDHAHGVVEKKVSSGNTFKGVVRYKGISGGSISSSSKKSTGSDGSWCEVTINQNGVGHSKGCTVCTLQLILQNSKQLKENQLKGSITSSTSEYKKFDSACSSAGFQSGDAWSLGNFASGGTSLCDSTWTNVKKVDGQDDLNIKSGYTNAIVGMGKKDFKDMTHSEQASCMKAIWNSGYFSTFCVEYEDVKQESNGPDNYKAAHATMLAGVKDKKIYINDPATGKVEDYDNRSAKGGKYNLMYVVLFKNDKTSPKDIAGVEAGDGGESETNKDDEKNAENLGIPVSSLNGFYSESQLSAYCRMNEVDIHEMFLDNATRDTLAQDDLTSLANWELNTREEKKDNGVIMILRRVVQILGIIMTFWGVLIYLAYWFDKTNIFFDVSIMSIITFGKIRAANDDGEATFSVRSLGEHTELSVNNRQAMCISLIAVSFGALLISGVLYRFLIGIVNFIFGLLGY